MQHVLWWVTKETRGPWDACSENTLLFLKEMAISKFHILTTSSPKPSFLQVTAGICWNEKRHGQLVFKSEAQQEYSRAWLPLWGARTPPGMGEAAGLSLGSQPTTLCLQARKCCWPHIGAMGIKEAPLRLDLNPDIHFHELGYMLHLSKPQFSHLQSGVNVPP